MPRKILSPSKIYAIMDGMESVELSNALLRHAEKLREDAQLYGEHYNDPLAERTHRMADKFERLSEAVFGNIVRVCEEP